MLIRSLAWWLKKADDENETVGAASPRSKRTLAPIELTDEEKTRLLSLACRHDWEWRVSGSVCKVCGIEQREAYAAQANVSKQEDRD